MLSQPYHVDPANRFALREIRADDLAGLENLNKLVFFAHFRHVDSPAEFLRAALSSTSEQTDTLLCHGVVLPSHDSCLIGFMAAVIRRACPEDTVDSVEIGYALLPADQGRGIARSALSVFLPRILTPSVTEVRAVVDPENSASIRLLETVGLVRVGLPGPSKYLGNPDNPAHYQAGILQYRPRITYRAEADVFR